MNDLSFNMGPKKVLMTVKSADKEMLLKVDQTTGKVDEVVSVKKTDSKEDTEKATVSEVPEEKRAAELKAEQEAVARSTQETIKSNIAAGDFNNAKTAYNMAAMVLDADQLKAVDFAIFKLTRDSLDASKANEAYLRAMGRTSDAAESKMPFGFDQATA